VDAFDAWVKAQKSRVARGLSHMTSGGVSANSGVIDVASLALRELDRCEKTVNDPSTGLRRAAAASSGGKQRRRGAGGVDALHA